MRGRFPAILAVGLVVWVAGLARAQDQSGLRGAGGALGGFHLIALPSVQEELKLDPDQAKKVRAVADSMKGKFEETMKTLQTGPPDGRLKKLPAMAQAHYEEGMTALSQILKPAQIDRFDQILFQQRGAAAMLEPSVSKKLKLTEAQSKKVAGLVASARNQQGQAVQSAQGDAKAAGPKLQAIAREANARALALLNAGQQRIWKEITGPPFEPRSEENGGG